MIKKMSGEKAIETALVSLSTICLGGIASLICFEVFCRYTKLLWFDWLEELVRYLGIGCVMFIAGPITLWGKHLAIDILVGRLGVRKRRIQEIIANSLGFVLCGFVVWQSYLMTMKYFNMGVRGPSGDFLLWPVILVFCLGFLLSALAFVVRLANILTDHKQV